MRFFILFLTVLSMTACGGGYNPDKDNLRGATPLGESHYFDLGNGRGLMANAPNSVSSGANFEVSFAMEEAGTFTLVTFANNTLEGGLNISFQRVGQILKVTASSQGQYQDWSARFSHVNAGNIITLTFDVHNNERPAHILIWEGSKNSSLNRRNALYNSAEDSLDLGYDSSPGNGTGRNWGFQFENAQVIKALLSSPQDQH